MDKLTKVKKQCIICGNPTIDGTNFCNLWCFELWYSLKQAELLQVVLELISD